MYAPAPFASAGSLRLTEMSRGDRLGSKRMCWKVL